MVGQQSAFFNPKKADFLCPYLHNLPSSYMLVIDPDPLNLSLKQVYVDAMQVVEDVTQEVVHTAQIQLQELTINALNMDERIHVQLGKGKKGQNNKASSTKPASRDLKSQKENERPSRNRDTQTFRQGRPLGVPGPSKSKESASWRKNFSPETKPTEKPPSPQDPQKRETKSALLQEQGQKEKAILFEPEAKVSELKASEQPLPRRRSYSKSPRYRKQQSVQHRGQPQEDSAEKTASSQKTWSQKDTKEDTACRQRVQSQEDTAGRTISLQESQPQEEKPEKTRSRKVAQQRSKSAHARWRVSHSTEEEASHEPAQEQKPLPTADRASQQSISWQEAQQEETLGPRPAHKHKAGRAKPQGAEQPHHWQKKQQNTTPSPEEPTHWQKATMTRKEAAEEPGRWKEGQKEPKNGYQRQGPISRQASQGYAGFFKPSFPNRAPQESYSGNGPQQGFYGNHGAQQGSYGHGGGTQYFATQNQNQHAYGSSYRQAPAGWGVYQQRPAAHAILPFPMTAGPR